MNLKKLIDEYPTKNKEGFTHKEILELIEKLPMLEMFNKETFWASMNGHTCMIINEEIINYHCDIRQGIILGYVDGFKEKEEK